MDKLGLIAGGGRFPALLIDAARQCGVRDIVCVGFPGQTAPNIAELVDRMFWLEIGQLGKVIKTFKVPKTCIYKNLEKKLRLSILVGVQSPPRQPRNAHEDCQ